MDTQSTPYTDRATRVTQILPRDDGSEVKIVAETMFGSGLHPSVGVDVYKRVNREQPWQLCSDRPAPNWREMSVQEYKLHGRSEALRTVSPGEILKVVSLLGRPLCEFDAPAHT